MPCAGLSFDDLLGPTMGAQPPPQQQQQAQPGLMMMGGGGEAGQPAPQPSPQRKHADPFADLLG